MKLNNVYIRIDWPESQEWFKYKETVAAFADDEEDCQPTAFVPNQIYSGYIKGTLKVESQSPDD